MEMCLGLVRWLEDVFLPEHAGTEESGTVHTKGHSAFVLGRRITTDNAFYKLMIACTFLVTWILFARHRTSALMSF